MLTIGRSNYLRFNHPEEAKLMKSVLPSGHVSMAPIQFTPNEQCLPTGNFVLDIITDVTYIIAFKYLL